MPTLYISRTGDESDEYRVWPKPEPIPPGYISEANAYAFHLRECPNGEAADLLVDGIMQEALRPHNQDIATWRWQPGFHAGKVRILLELPEARTAEVELVTDPDLHKLTRHQFDTMVRDILKETFQLFGLSSFRFGIGRGRGSHRVPLAKLEFLHSRFQQILAALRSIDERPIRSLKAVDRIKPLGEARRVRPTELFRSLRSQRTAPTARDLGLRQKLQANLPVKVHETSSTSCTDIAEHRQIKSSLVSWASWLRVVAAQMTASSSGVDNEADTQKTKLQEVWRRRCQQMSRDLKAFSETGFLRDVPVSDSLPKPSPVFTHNPRYKRFFRLCQDVELGISNVSGDFLDMPLARTFELYELWAFLKLATAAAHVFNCTDLDLSTLFEYDPNSASVRLPTGDMVLQLDGDIALCFRRLYREFWLASDGQGSFSRTMVPDISIRPSPSQGESARLIVLDAKYRINQQLNDAIASTHMYRDAIVQASDDQPERIVCGAYLVTPHCACEAGDWREASMPGRLFYPEYRREFKFGAVSLYPGMTNKDAIDALRAILMDSIDDFDESSCTT